MPRDGNGNYSLPAGNPVIAGTLIESSWANATMEDIAIALTNSLSRNGNGGMLAPFGIPDGSIAAPGIFFTSQVNMGLHRAALNDLRVTMDGGSVLQITDTFINVEVPEIQINTVPILTETGGTISAVVGSLIINADADNTLDVDRPGTDPASFLLRNDEGGTRFQSDGNALAIHQIDAAGAVLRRWMTGGTSGEVSLFYDDVLTLITTAAGVNITGDINATDTITVTGAEIGLDANRNAAGPSRLNVRNTEGGVSLRTDAAGFQVYQTSSAGTLQDIWIDGLANGSTRIRYNDAIRLATTSAGVSVTGTNTSSGDAIASGVNLNSAIAALQAFVNDFVVTAANKGRIRIPYSSTNAILIQWGSVAGTLNGISSDTFVEPFTDIYQAVDSSTESNTQVTSISNTGINFDNNNLNNTVRYIAIGRRAI